MTVIFSSEILSFLDYIFLKFGIVSFWGIE